MNNPTEEVWKTIPSYEHYEVSTHGRVRSLYHNNGGLNFKRAVPLIINGSVVKGYRQVGLRPDFGKKNNTRKTCSVHRLVLMTFVGPCPENMQGCHNDGDSLNNSLSNLRWDTNKKNADDKKKHGTYLRGEDIVNSRLSQEKVHDIRYLLKEKVPQGNIAKIYGIGQSTVGRINSKKSWGWLKSTLEEQG